MNERETREATGGYEIPTHAANDELVAVFRNNHVTFRSHSAGFDVYLDGDENANIVREAAKRGYEVSNVKQTDGPFNVEVTLGTKRNVRVSNDGKEESHRCGDSDE